VNFPGKIIGISLVSIRSLYKIEENDVSVVLLTNGLFHHDHGIKIQKESHKYINYLILL
jgi:hypothetical protein